MRKYLLAAVAAATLATPAMARDGSGYVGVEGGILFPRNQDVFGSVDFTAPPTGTADIAEGDIGRVRWKNGFDIDLIGGYDFGMFRVEGELGYKRAKAKDVRLDDDFIVGFNSGAGTDLIDDDFDLGGKVSVLSAMVNALVDFGGNDGVGGYFGGGVGYARVKEFGESDSGLAWQLLAGVYAPISNNIDVGLKYRYFRSSKLDIAEAAAFTAGAGPCGPIATPSPCSGGTAVFGIDDRFTSHSLLASLIFNFGAPAAVEAPPPPPPPPPPAVEPATQTCPDGSVILATSVCPPPPPPPPPPPVERGERGR